MSRLDWLTPRIIAAAAGAPPRNAEKWHPHLVETCETYDIDTPRRVVAFLAQIGHESDGFYYVSEIWGPTPAQRRYEGRADLGNTQQGDGSRFRGHGLIQITGRANHAAVRDGLRERLFEPPDFEQEPEALMQPQWAALSAGWYWHSRKLNALADAPGIGSFKLITKRINGGTNGEEDRLRRWRAGLAVLSAVGVPLDPAPKENP